MSPRSAQITDSPFPVDEAAAARHAALERSVGHRFTARLAEIARSRSPGGDRSFLPGDEVRALREAFALRSVREAAVLALPAAATLARPTISDYHVGAVGVTPDGALILGGNLEFPGASIHHTVHAEGFVVLRARALRLPVSTLTVRQARPCAHCRQVLAEMAWADALRVVDPLGADVALWDLYPVPFTPRDLDEDGSDPAADHPAPGLRDPGTIPGDVAAALVGAGASAHAPYSSEPAAIVLRLRDGRLVQGAVLESVAFNPTIGPLQDALVALAAWDAEPRTIREAWLGVVAGGRVNHVEPTGDLLRAVAPGAVLHLTYWS